MMQILCLSVANKILLTGICILFGYTLQNISFVMLTIYVSIVQLKHNFGASNTSKELPADCHSHLHCCVLYTDYLLNWWPYNINLCKTRKGGILIIISIELTYVLSIMHVWYFQIWLQPYFLVILQLLVFSEHVNTYFQSWLLKCWQNGHVLKYPRAVVVFLP